MSTHKWQLSIKGVVLALLQSRALPVEDSVINIYLIFSGVRSIVQNKLSYQI